jgi:class 3 adenylate cyclase
MRHHTGEVPLPKREELAEVDVEPLDDYTRVAHEGDVHAIYRLIQAGEKVPLDLTVVVFDLCESTSFRAQYGAREAFGRIERLNYIVEYWVKRHSGVTVKHIGDGVMASFPPVPGDKPAGPIRAVQCAADVIKTLAIPPGALRSASAPKVRTPMFCKVGIARGPADTIELNQGVNVHVTDYLGKVLDRAARVASVCRPNQILIDEDVHSALPHGGMQKTNFGVRGPYDVPLKGLGTIKVFDLLMGEAGPRPDFNLAAIDKLASFGEITDSATRLLDAAVQDQELGKTEVTDRGPYLMALVDFPAFASFSYPEESSRYRRLFAEFARNGGEAALCTLSPRTANASSRLQFTEGAFRAALQDPEYLAKLTNFGLDQTPTYDELINLLLAKDAEAVQEFRDAGVKIVEMTTDPRLHVWIRGTEEAVVSFVMVVKRKRTVVDWSEKGFQTTDRTVVAMLRNYVRTLIEAPL